MLAAQVTLGLRGGYMLYATSCRVNSNAPKSQLPAEVQIYQPSSRSKVHGRLPQKLTKHGSHKPQALPLRAFGAKLDTLLKSAVHGCSSTGQEDS